MSAMDVQKRIAGRNVGVVGIARSGAAVARLLRELGATVFASDSAATDDVTALAAELSALGIATECGKHTDRIYQSDFAVVSPGIPPTAPVIVELKKRGIPLFSELEVASWALDCKMIAVTGSNGKTTTTSMIHQILQSGGYESALCGNIGTPLSAVTRSLPRHGVAVVEVSSYQLELIESFAPDVAVITNITEDHLERHGDLRGYREAKLRITESQSAEQTLTLNLDSPALDALAIHTNARRVFFGAADSFAASGAEKTDSATWLQSGALWARINGQDIKLLERRRLSVPGAHNVENALAAATAALAFGVNPDAVSEGLSEFRGVEHRIESVGDINGVHFVNDSKATNIDATTKALEALDGRVWLILGGRGKGEDFRRLARFCGSPVVGVIAIGEAREEIFNSLGKDTSVVFAESLAEALERAADQAQSGDTVLLSPACASFDMFKNFEERGATFKTVFHQLKLKRESDVYTG